jgi:hypothetical protein
MGFWSSIGSAIGSSSNQVKEEDPTYKKYAAEMSNFKLEDKNVKTALSTKKQSFSFIRCRMSWTNR